MKKIKKTDKIWTFYPDDFSTPILDVILWLKGVYNTWDEKGYSNLHFDWDYNERYFMLYGDREETDKELKRRKKASTARLLRKAEKTLELEEEEMALYKKLKEKYDDF
jgi:hypothetical protein